MSKKKVRRAKKQSSAPKETDRAAEIVASSQVNRREKRRVRLQTGIPKKITSVDQLQGEYAYVLKDLRLIFAIAAVMFLILFGLNIFLG